jgi:hypothetical protein
MAETEMEFDYGLTQLLDSLVKDFAGPLGDITTEMTGRLAVGKLPDGRAVQVHLLVTTEEDDFLPKATL